MISAVSAPPARRRSVSQRLQDDFLQRIRTGDWAPNQPIPGENDLAREHGACRSTVRRAIRDLEVAGLLSAVQGKGRIVVSRPRSSGRMVGLISSGPDIGSGSGFHIAQGLLQRVGSEGDHLATFAFSELNYSPIAQRLQTYADLAGVGLLGPAFPSAEIPDLALRLPVVATARDERALGIPSFFIDYGYHAFQAAMFLLERGHRRIVVTHGKKTYFDRVGANIEQGVEWAFAQKGEDPGQILAIDATLSRVGGEEIYQTVQEKDLKPTAIISYGTWPVTGFLAKAEQENSSLSGIDAVILNDLEDASLAGRAAHFQCPYQRLAQDAATTLYQLIEGGQPSKIANGYRGEMVGISQA